MDKEKVEEKFDEVKAELKEEAGEFKADIKNFWNVDKKALVLFGAGVFFIGFVVGAIIF